MQVVEISKKRFKELEPLKLPQSIFNTEAKMYLLPGKRGWARQNYVLKSLYHTNDEIFSNKLYTVSELINNRNLINMEELILPEALVTVGHEIIGFTEPFVPNINLQTILDSPTYTVAEKVAYLKEVGAILAKMQQLRNYSKITDFYLNDVHESNFILNMETGKINAVDLDSAKIGHNLTFVSRYLTPFSELSNVSKYVPLSYEDGTAGGFYKVDSNTEIYCYIVMIFNYFFGARICNLTVEEYFYYLDYLANLGVSKELVDIFSYIYVNRENINPYEYLDELIPYYGRTNHHTFEKVRRKVG